MMKGLKWATCVLCVVLVGIFFSVSPVFAQAKPIELRYSNFFPPPHKNSVLAEEWAKEIEQKTGGKVKITLHHGGTLTPSAQCYDGVVKGLSDIGMSVLGYTRGRFPLSEVSDLPLGYKNGLEATKIFNLYYQKFQPKELEDTKVMYLHAHGPGLLHTKKPVAKLEDLKGMKIACHGLSSKIVAALGGVPVAMPMPERYDALQKGVAEGGVFPLEALEGWKLGEVVSNTTLNYGSAYSTGFFVVMNKDKWNSLPPDVQKVIEEVNKTYIEKYGKGWDEIDTKGADFAKAKGLKIIALSKEEDARWAALVKPVIDEYIKDMKGKNLPGEEVVKYCMDELKKMH